jgi:hypothetical protein
MREPERSPGGELHPLYAAHSTQEAIAVLGRGARPILAIPSFCRTRSHPETLPSGDTKGAGTPRLFAGTDLHLRQGEPRLLKDVHPFHGYSPQTRLRLRRSSTLHCGGRLSSDTAWDRGIGAPSQNTDVIERR